jgi:hypothetical protein
MVGDVHKDISNQFKSLSREISKPNNTKNISKGLNNLSKSFNKMPKNGENERIENNDDLVAALTEIAQDLLKGE